jgi:peptide/nickel transport system permease protein
MGAAGAAEVARQVRAAMVEALASEYVRTLTAAGIGRLSIVARHALKNSAVQLLTIIGLQVNRFLGATVVIEAVFGIGGLGSLIVAATQQRDLPTVQGVMVVMVCAVLVINIVVDALHRVVDPRVR